jgi:phage terminase small subunit
MTGLTNMRHELFCQELAKGKTQEAAYIAAGYAVKGARANASTLIANHNILDRIAVLKQQGAERAATTIASLVEELEVARLKAMAADTVQASAMIAATMAKAKLLGLLTDRIVEPSTGPLKIEYVVPAPYKHVEGYSSGAIDFGSTC